MQGSFHAPKFTQTRVHHHSFYVFPLPILIVIRPSINSHTETIISSLSSPWTEKLKSKEGTFLVEVDLADTVLEIKEKIEIHRGIPVSKQTLTFNNVVLQDERDVYSELAQDPSLTLIIAPEPEREFAVPSAPVKGGTSSGSNEIKLKW